MRKRIFEIIEANEKKSLLGNIYDAVMMLAIIISMIPLCTKSTGRWTVIVDIVTVAIFVLDYLLREITADLKYPEKGKSAFFYYPFTVLAIIDLLSILPSFGMFDQGFKILKIFRLFKTLKVLRALRALKAFKALKLIRYSRSVDLIMDVIKKQKEPLITVGGFAVGYIFIAALVVFNIEPDTFSTFFDALYWACVSLTTVGYGDIYPVSTAGRIFTMLSSVVGIAIVALPSGIITAGYMEAVNKKTDEKETEKKD